jgi:CheY-like chemotaxis protein
MVPAGNYVLLSVSDTGDGISSQHINHIFEPFYSTKEEGKGTGLGLATVYGIVKQSGGYIWVYSEPRLGTAFKIYLPRVNAKASSFPPPVRQEPVPNGCETILLVEDEAAVRSSTRDFLRSIGYIVLEAGNGQQALELARSYPAAIDLLMSDVVMPGISGVQLASTLISERPKTKVFFVSGYAESTVLRHGHVDVLSRFLQKPFSLKTMAWKLREILQSQPAPVISVRAAGAAG